MTDQAAQLDIPLPVAGAESDGAAYALPDKPLFTIRPSRTWAALNLRELWAYRELLYFLTWRDVKVRYKQTTRGCGRPGRQRIRVAAELWRSAPNCGNRLEVASGPSAWFPHERTIAEGPK